MGKIITTLLDDFTGGIANDLRHAQPNQCALTKNFDNTLNYKKLTPNYTTTAKETKAMKIALFLYNKDAATPTYKLWGLGADGVAGAGTKICAYKIDPTSDTNDWAVSPDPSTKNLNYNIFFYYKEYLYTTDGSANILRFAYTGGAWDDAYQTIAFTSYAHPVHHPSTDTAYFFFDNDIHQLDNTTWDKGGGDDAPVLTLPTNMKIVSACAYGNFLAVACVTLGSNPRSVVYLWDMDSSIDGVSQIIDFGRGEIVHIGELNNSIIAVMSEGGYFGINRKKFVVKQAVDRYAVTLNKINYYDFTISSRPPIVTNDKIYFLMTGVRKYSTEPETWGSSGVWSVDFRGQLKLEFVEPELEAAADNRDYDGFFLLDGQWWIAHSSDGSINRNPLTAAVTDTATGIYETAIFNDGDPHSDKKLLGVAIMHEPLATSATVVVKYRIDANLDGGSWTTLLTSDTDDATYKEATKNEAGANLPTYKEIQFRFESTIGATITGFKFNRELIDNRTI